MALLSLTKMMLSLSLSYVAETKMMAVNTIQPDHPPEIIFDGQPIENVDTFEYLGVDIPIADHGWWQCVQRRMDIGWQKYYQFESDCRHRHL